MNFHPQLDLKLLRDSWDVFMLFLIPIGGGIPAGVVLAQARGVTWPIMLILYFFSDVVLACVFEPFMLLFLHFSRKNPRLARVREAFAKSTQKTVSHYGINPSRFSLIMITFGTDPMTGRSVAKAAGHNFFSGWMLTIIGDMIFFSVIMVSTIWLNNILGDGTWTAILITLIVIGGPQVYNSWKRRRTRQR